MEDGFDNFFDLNLVTRLNLWSWSYEELAAAAAIRFRTSWVRFPLEVELVMLIFLREIHFIDAALLTGTENWISHMDLTLKGHSQLWLHINYDQGLQIVAV